MSFESTRKSTTGSAFCLTDLLANEVRGGATSFTIDTATRRVSYDTPDEDISYIADSMKVFNLPVGEYVKYDYFFEGTEIDDNMPQGIDRAEWQESISIDFNSYKNVGEFVQDEVFIYTIYYDDGRTENCSVTFNVLGTLEDNPRRLDVGDERSYIQLGIDNIEKAVKNYKPSKSRGVKRKTATHGVRG